MPRRIERSATALCTCAILLLSACDGSDDDDNGPPPQPDPVLPDLALEAAFPNLSFASPVLMLQAPGDDARWFAVEKSGVVRRFENDPAAGTAEVFVDIDDRVNADYAESGLLGMAFHPGFPTTPYVYLSYTANGLGGGSPLTSRISRFVTGDGGLSLDPSGEEIMLTVARKPPITTAGTCSSVRTDSCMPRSEMVAGPGTRARMRRIPRTCWAKSFVSMSTAAARTLRRPATPSPATCRARPASHLRPAAVPRSSPGV